MNYRIHISGGGIFSIIHQFFETILDNIQDINEIDDIEIIIKNHIVITEKFIFNNIFIQNENINDSKDIFMINTKNSFLQANLFHRIDDLKKINKKLKYQKFILDEANKYVNNFNIDENTFGIHIRLTDMNSIHPEYGIISIERYINETKKILYEHQNINKLFIASDNYESINIFTAGTLLNDTIYINLVISNRLIFEYNLVKFKINS